MPGQDIARSKNSDLSSVDANSCRGNARLTFSQEYRSPIAFVRAHDQAAPFHAEHAARSTKMLEVAGPPRHEEIVDAIAGDPPEWRIGTGLATATRKKGPQRKLRPRPHGETPPVDVMTCIGVRSLIRSIGM